jgi:hypothetical protein
VVEDSFLERANRSHRGALHFAEVDALTKLRDWRALPSNQNTALGGHTPPKSVTALRAPRRIAA